MRVLLTTDSVGGVWTFTRELAAQLLSLGHDVALASFGRELSAFQQSWCDEMCLRHDTRFVLSASDSPLEWMQENIATFDCGKRVLLNLCAQFSPDVIHSSQFCWGALDIPIPTVVTAHSDVMSWADSCRKCALEQSQWLRQYQQLVQLGLDMADAVTAPTEWMASALRRNFSVPADIRVISNGRSLSSCAWDESRPLQAVSVGRMWDEAKGLSTLLDAKFAMPIVIAGESQFEDVGTDVPVDFVGALDESEMLKRFRQSSVYVVASVYEPFGLAPLEAALCGCAVVARDLQSLREIWGNAAIYFQDVHELKAILEQLAIDPAFLRAARLAALRRAQRFPAEKTAHAYITLYDELMSAARAKERIADAA